MAYGYPDMEKPLPKPSCFEKMIEIAEKIGSSFDFVRVDLYCEANKVFFGEATFYPSSGYPPLSPEIWDSKFGEPWNVLSPNHPVEMRT